jgi:hypothetical protein
VKTPIAEARLLQVIPEAPVVEAVPVEVAEVVATPEAVETLIF